MPSLTFPDKTILHEGDETIILRHYRNAHTDGDIVIHFKKANIYHTGDILVTFGELPHIDEAAKGSIYGVIRAVTDLIRKSNNQTLFIPGHGPVVTRKEVKEYRKLLVTLLRIVERGVKKNIDIEVIIQQVQDTINYQYFDGDNFIRQTYRAVLKRFNYYDYSHRSNKDVQEKDGNIFKLHPNPNNGVFSLIPNNHQTISDVRVFNQKGELVHFEEKIDPNQKQIDIGHLHNGTYFLKAKIGKKTIDTKIMIENQ